MYAYQIASWNGFLSVAASVAATLTGLLFVAISINLCRILQFPRLADRAVEAILQMFGALILSMIALLPGQSELVLGIELAGTGLVLWIMQTMLQVRTIARDARRRPVLSVALAQIATVPFCAAGLSLAIGELGGLYWLGTGIILSITVGVSNAWVLLVEIHR